MGRELDRRRPAAPADITPRGGAAGGASIVRHDPETRNPAVLTWGWGAPEQGRFVPRALEYLAAAAPVLGLADGEPVEYRPDPHVQRTSSGAVVAHVQQRYKSIPIFGAAEAVNFGPDGAVTGCGGAAFTVTADLAVEPALGPGEAVGRAAAHVAQPDPGAIVPRVVEVGGFAPRILAVFGEIPERPAVVAAGPFGAPFLARLTWFPIEGALRLAWDVTVTMPGQASRYRTVVDAGDGAVVYCREMTACVAARGLVPPSDGTGTATMVDFPRPLTDYGLPIPPDLPPGFPDDWVSGEAAAGNNAVPRRGKDGPTARGTVTDGIVTFDSVDEADRLLVSALYHSCSAHDAFYLLGFREGDGNFQTDNLGRGGTPGDAIEVLVVETAFGGDALMDMHPVDGSAATMWLGPAREKEGRHTALDASIVFHEYTHGVTERLVGGGMDFDPLTRGQSVGMREGWGDFFACALLDTDRIGVTTTASPGGMRTAPYDDAYPGHFGMLGSPPFDAPHVVGEVWAAALLAVSRTIGKELALRLAFDGLKLMANPGFLDGRDAIVAALDNLAGDALDAGEHATATRGLWAAFARFGLGPRAAALQGANLSGAIPDFATTPGRPGSDDRIAGGARVPGTAIANAAEVSDVITIADSGPIRRIAVTVDISHPTRQALRVTLHAPAGAGGGRKVLDPQMLTWTTGPSEVVLHKESTDPGSADDLRRTWDTAVWDTFVGDRPAAPLLRYEARGDWRLTVRDMQGGKGEGRLNSWSLALTL